MHPKEHLLFTPEGFKGDIAVDDETREEHAKDRSVFKVTPSAVFYPKDVGDIALLLRGVYEKKERGEHVSVSVRAGGTCMDGGALDGGYMLNLTRYMHGVSIDGEKKTATVHAGAYFRDIEDAAEKHGLMFPAYPSSKRICGIGGMLGNNASGEKSIRFGATIDNVLSLEVVLSDGTVIETGEKSLTSLTEHETQIKDLYDMHAQALKEAMGAVSKVASGYRLDRVMKENSYDLSPLFIGAQGTLGIITKATLRLVPIPTHTALVHVACEALNAIPDILETALPLHPDSVETFDKYTYNAAKKTMQKEIALTEHLVKESDLATILVQFSEDSEEETSEKARAFLERVQGVGRRASFIEDKPVHDALWALRRGAYTEIQNLDTNGMSAVPCIEDVIVPISSMAGFLEELSSLLEKRNILYGFHGHIGEGSIRMIPFFDLKKDNASEEIIALIREATALVKKYKGNTSADHSDGIIRSPFLRDFYGEELYSVFQKIKEVFDPLYVLNPKKKTGSSIQDIDTFLIKE